MCGYVIEDLLRKVNKYKTVGSVNVYLFILKSLADLLFGTF